MGTVSAIRRHPQARKQEMVLPVGDCRKVKSWPQGRRDYRGGELQDSPEGIAGAPEKARLPPRIPHEQEKLGNGHP
mgnify:FL=1